MFQAQPQASLHPLVLGNLPVEVLGNTVCKRAVPINHWGHGLDSEVVQVDGVKVSSFNEVHTINDPSFTEQDSILEYGSSLNYLLAVELDDLLASNSDVV